VQESANGQITNIKSNDKTIELRASDQIEIIQCEPNSSCVITNSNLTPKINFLNKLNLVTSTPINGNLNKTYTIRKEVDLKQDLLDSIKEYQKIVISQLKNRILEKIAKACERPNNEQTDLTSRGMALPEGDKNQYGDNSYEVTTTTKNE